MRSVLGTLLIGALLSATGCIRDGVAEGGPYIDISWDDSYCETDCEIDLGEVSADTVGSTEVTIQNVGPRLFEVEITDGSVANFVDFYCLTSDDEDCLELDMFESHDWFLGVHTYCTSTDNTNIRLKLLDPESEGTSVHEMADITLEIVWTTVDCP
jgi:hypothetical protein